MRTTRAGQSALLLLDAVGLLAARKIPYAVVGAMAASVHGIVRASLDAGAVLSLTIQETPTLEREFSAAGFQTELRRGDPDDPIAGILTLSDAYKNSVDLLVGLRGLDPAVFSRTVELPFHGTALKVVGLEDFIAMKIFAGGPQDLTDARAAIIAAGDRLNRSLAKSLAQRFGRGVAEVWPRCGRDAVEAHRREQRKEGMMTRERPPSNGRRARACDAQASPCLPDCHRRRLRARAYS